jgi:hypothetical protein
MPVVFVVVFITWHLVQTLLTSQGMSDKKMCRVFGMEFFKNRWIPHTAIVQKHHKRLFKKIHVKNPSQKVEAEKAVIAFFLPFLCTLHEERSEL